MHKNRYRGIYPYDDARVLMRGGETDYINASYIDNAKCEQYWPHHNQRILYGDIEVVCKVDKLYADFIWRHFTLSKNSEERILHHLQFTSWPAKDVPDNVTALIELRQRVNDLPSSFNGPVIVHCSAGVGRTGIYIALDILTNEGEAEGAIDIPGCVFNMRQNRPNMIQTLKLQLNQEQKSDKELQAMERNRLLTIKNRKLADIPGDLYRPRLYLFLKPGESDYINAIYINSFKTKNRFLVAQTPLPDTVSDFITLAVQENCSCIVSMEAYLEKHEGIGLYFPCDNQTMKKGMVSVRSSTAQRAVLLLPRVCSPFIELN
ncbi:receptor-type tyrosine-protein phosphatase kappa-like [Mya arenaria]|uniref:receptor-type tyrosine-protein phosphatase kappa-like n=1 Tax=Mya arenaria TaxID=6604 RepID=UPI0022E09831|nr:receptor-type tyrosine-protein phosphatase kappa-like [Mya arenaria]